MYAVIGYNKVEGVKCIRTPNIKMSSWFSCQLDSKTIFQVMNGSNKWCRILENSSSRMAFSERSLPEYLGSIKEWSSLCKISATKVALIGGRFAAEVFRSCLHFDLVTQKWSEIPSLNVARMKSSSCRLQGYIYVFGGFTQTLSSKLNSIEKLPVLSGSAR